jgi:hypothetical protein
MADVLHTAEGNTGLSDKARRVRLGGVEEHGTRATGFPGTREILSSPRHYGEGVAANTSRPAGVTRTRRERTQGTRGIADAKG